MRFGDVDEFGNTVQNGELNGLAWASHRDGLVYEVHCEVEERDQMTGWLIF